MPLGRPYRAEPALAFVTQGVALGLTIQAFQAGGALHGSNLRARENAQTPGNNCFSCSNANVSFGFTGSLTQVPDPSSMVALPEAGTGPHTLIVLPNTMPERIFMIDTLFSGRAAWNFFLARRSTS